MHARLPRVTVRPADNLPPLLLTVYDAQAVLLPSDDPRGVWLVDVQEPLAFKGVFRNREREAASVAARERTTLAEGVVQLAAGASVSVLRVQGDHVVASLQVGGFDIDRISIPCSALTVVKERQFADSQWRQLGWAAREAELDLSPRSGAEPTVTVRPPQLMAGSKADERGWVQIVGSDGDGRIVGWAPLSHLVWTDLGPSGGLGLSGVGEGTCGGCGCGIGLGTIGCIGSGCGANPAPAYTGPAKVDAGTAVYAEPGRGEWARIPQEQMFDVAFEDGAPWGRITSATGAGVSDHEVCCPSLDHAWVRRSAVRIPPGR